LGNNTLTGGTWSILTISGKRRFVTGVVGGFSNVQNLVGGTDVDIHAAVSRQPERDNDGSWGQ